MTAIALDAVLIFLLPLFMNAAKGNAEAARHAVIQLLQSYGATTDDELLLAAEIIALSFATLDNLSKSVADPDLSINTRLRLRANASSLSRETERNRQALAKGRAVGVEPAGQAPETLPPLAAEPPPSQSPELPAAVQKVRDAIVEAAPALAQTLTNNGHMLSRQQRRLLTRKAEKARAAQEREAHRAARLAARAQPLGSVQAVAGGQGST